MTTSDTSAISSRTNASQVRPVEKDTLSEEPALAYQLFARVDVWSVGVDQVEHGSELP